LLGESRIVFKSVWTILSSIRELINPVSYTHLTLPTID
jgi:hypothetical protein